MTAMANPNQVTTRVNSTDRFTIAATRLSCADAATEFATTTKGCQSPFAVWPAAFDHGIQHYQAENRGQQFRGGRQPGPLGARRLAP